MTVILAISGKKQSGKTTFVERFRSEYDDGGLLIKDYSFADALKGFLVDAMGLLYCQVNGTDEEKNSSTEYLWETLPSSVRELNGNKTGNMSGRELMQVFGTDIMRNMFDDRIWVNSTFRAIERDKPDIALIPDTRFPSEVCAIYDNDGFVIRLTRDVSDGDSHSSEIALDDWDWSFKPSNTLVIPDDLDIQETWNYAEQFYKELFSKIKEGKQ